MKIILQLCLLILLSISGLKAQTLSVTDVNTQNYPNAVSAGFWVIGADGRPITNLTTANFSVTVNGQPRQVISAGCGTSIPNPDSMSAVLTIDISSSMVALAGGMSRLNIAKNAANMFINNLPLGISEAAITSFNHNSFVNQDLTVMRPWLTSAINSLTHNGNTSYNEAFLNANSGALNIAAGGSRSKKVIIFLTDGNPTETVNIQQITTLANANNIDIYCLCLGMAAPQSLKDIANGTGGRCFENINSLDDIRNAYSYILMYSQGYGTGCGITWQDSITCNEARTVKIKLLSPFVDSTTVSYSQPQGLVPHLSFTSSSNINFGCVTAGNTKDTVLTLVASGSNVTINGASSNNSSFTIIPPPTFPVVLRPGIDTLKVRVRYTSTDSTAKTTIISFTNNSCDNPTATINTGCTPDIIFQEEEGESLKLIFPNGTEQLINCTDTTIRWTGVPPQTRVVLEYNINNSSTWINIDSNATGLAYRWTVPDIQGNQFKMRVRVYDSLWIDGSDSTFILGNSTFTCIDWNSDKTKIAAGTMDGKIVILDKLTGAIENSYQVIPNNYSVDYIAWSPTDETKIAFYDLNSGAIKFLNPITGDVSTALPGTSNHTLFKWNNDGTNLAAVYPYYFTNRTVKIFNSNGVALNPLSEQTSAIYSIAWSEDDSRFAVGTRDSTVYVYNMTSANPTVNWAFTGTIIPSGLAFNPLNSDSIAVAGAYGIYNTHIYRKNNNSADLVRTITGTGTDGNLQWSPSGERLIYLPWGDLLIYNLNTNSVELDIDRFNWNARYGTQGIVMNKILYNEGLSELTGAFENEGIITYNTNTGAIINSIHTLNGAASSVSFSPDYTKLAVTNANIIRIWDLASRTLDRVITNNSDIITGMQWNPVSNKIAAVSNFNSVKIWNPLTGALETTVSGLTFNSGLNNKEQQIAWNPNGSKLAVTRGGYIDIYDTTNWNAPLASYPTNLYITSLTWSPDNVNILVGVDYIDLRMLNTNTPSGTWTTYNSGQPRNNENDSHPSWNASGNRFVYRNSPYYSNIGWQNYFQVYNQNNSNSPIVSRTQTNLILSLDWHRNRNKIASGAHNTGGFDIYSGRNYRLLKSYTGNSAFGNLGSTMSAKWCQDPTKLLLATGHKYGTVGLHYLPSVQEIIADTSDQFWSILKPLVAGQDVNMGNVAVGTTLDSTIIPYLTNNSSLPVDVDTIIITGADASSFSISPEFVACTIPNGGTKDLEVHFTPTSTGTKNAQIKVIVRCDTLTYTITGNGVTQTIFSFYNIIDFGRVRVGVCKDSAAYLVKNIGSSSVSITSKTMMGPDNIQFLKKGPAVPFTLAPNQLHIDTVSFKPNRIGKTSSQIGCGYNGIGSPAITILLGEGYGMPLIFGIDSCKFADINCSHEAKDTTIYIENVGDTVLTVNSTSLIGTNASSFSLVRSLTNALIQPNKRDSVIVRFNAYQYGTKMARLAVASNSEWKDNVKYIDIRAKRDNSELELIGAFINFGRVNTSTTTSKTFKIVNKGNQAFNWTLPINLGAFTIQSITPNPLPNYNDTATVTVRLITNSTPNQYYNTTYTFTDACGRTSTARFLANDTTAAPEITVVNNINIPAIICENYKDTTLTITNSGTANLIVNSVTFSGSDAGAFAFNPPSFTPITISPGASSELHIRFTPTSSGTKTATLTLKSNASNVIDSKSIINLSAIKDSIDFQIIAGNTVLNNLYTLFLRGSPGSTIDTVFQVKNLSTIITHIRNSPLQIIGVNPFITSFAINETKTIPIEYVVPISDTLLFNLTLTDECGREKKIVIQIVPVMQTISAITGINSVCVTQTTQLSNSIPTGIWSISPTSIATISSTGLVTGISAGTATVQYTVTNTSNCSDSVSYPITVNALPNPKISGDSLVCIGSPLTYSTAVAANTVYTWQVKRGIVISGAGSESISLRWDSAGMDTLSLIATDTLSHCSNTVQMYIRINPSLQISFASVRSICKGDSVHLHSQVSGGTAPYTYKWTARSGTALSNNNSDSLIVSPTETTIYDLIVTDSKQCTATAFVEVKVHKDVSITLPETLTFDKLPVGKANSDTSFTFINSGTDTITIDNLSIDAPFNITSSKTPITVQPGANITIKITFNPQAAGTYTEGLTIHGSPCDWVRTVIINAKADTLLFTQDISYVDFGKFKTCTSVDLDTVITIKNTGTSDMIIDFANSNDVSPFSMSNSTEKQTLKPNDSVKITVSYKPSVEGINSQKLKIPYQAGSVKGSIEIDLNGAYILPQLGLNPKLIDLGNILACDTNPIDTSFTLSNISAINLDSVSIKSLNKIFKVVDINNPFLIAENGDETINITADISNLPYGSFSDSIVVHYDCDNTDTLIIIGNKQQVSYSATDSLQFGRYAFCNDTQFKSDLLPIAINNNSSSGVVGKVSAFKFVNNYFTTKLKIGDSILSGSNEYQIYLNIDAGLPDGKYSDTMQIHIATSPCDTVLNISLYFEKVSEKLVYAQDVKFGTIIIDTFKTDSFIITNNGSGVTTIDTIAGLVAPFEVISTIPNLPATLAPKDSLKVFVKYSPTTLGTHTQMLNFSTTDTTCHRNIAIKLSGQSNSKLIAKYHIALDTVTVPVGSPATLHLTLLSSENLITEGVAKHYKIKLSFNSKLLMPEFLFKESQGTSMIRSCRTIEITGTTEKPSGLLRELRFKSALGNDTQTEVIIESVEWLDTDIQIIPEIDNGLVQLTNLCHEGGTRLINSSTPVLINKIRPNPVTTGEVNIDFTITEKGATELRLINNLGEVVKSIPINTETVGKRTETISLENISSGTYLLILKTPNWEDTQIMKVIK